MKFRRSLFWDVDPETIDPEKNARYIIERISEDGNDQEIRWMWNRYGKEEIGNVAKNSKILSPKSRNFWLLMAKSSV